MILAFLKLITQLALENFSLPDFQDPPPRTLAMVDFLSGNNLPKKVVTDGIESVGVFLQAKRALAIDVNSGAILYEKLSHEAQPIASITKLMTAMVVLDLGFDGEKVVQMLPSDERVGAFTNVYRYENIYAKDLLAASLIPSDNNATVALARSTGLSEVEFVEAMNKKAAELGMTDSAFAEPTGLSEGNKASAYDVARLIHASLQYPQIAALTTQEKYSFTVQGSGRKVNLTSTDYLLSNQLFTNGDYRILGGKTGFIDEAGYCFAVQLENKDGQKMIGVILGSQNIASRFQDMKALWHWVLTNYSWKN
jgi:D-alanyl-D-alanine endopeptidase (penicillin-binding protein 7)